MGFFLSSVREDITALDIKIGKWMEPIDRVREYHGVFKSVCDNFVIKRTQFSQIFGSEEKISLWQKSQTINALQIFCGLIYYAADGSFKSKLKFLFMLFDFNEIKSISIVDLEYMILSICNFTYKLLGKSNTKADELKLAEWLIKYFNPRKRINVTRLYHLCTVAPEIKDFLRISKIKIEQQFWPGEQINDFIYKQEQEMEISQRMVLCKKQRQNQINTKLSWFSHFCQKLTKPKYKKEVISNTRISWVYGIELSRVHKPFKTMDNSTIVYAISSKMIVYSITCNSQRIYHQHNREIQCFTIKQSENTVASAEGQKQSMIYIWNYNSLETRHIIKVQHQHKVHLMSYSLYSNVLATVGERENSPIHIFETNNYKLKSSFCISGAIIDMVPFYSPLNILDLPPYLMHYLILCQDRRIIVVDQNCTQLAHQFDCSITATAVIYVDQDCPYLRYFNNKNLRLFIITGHANGSVFVSQYNENSETNSLEYQKSFQILKLQDSISSLRVNSQCCFIVTGQELRVYSLNILSPHEDKNLAEQQSPRVIKLNEIQHLKLLSYKIRYLDLNEEEIHLITSEGDFIVIADRETIFDRNAFRDQESIRRVNTIVKFNAEMKAICFGQKQLNSVVLVVSEQSKIFQINPQTHQICLVVDISRGDIINVIDSAVSEEGVGYMIYGCKSGKLLIRLDWQEVAKVYDCGAEINDLKISNDTSYLLVATINSLMFFQLTPTFSSPRKITFENQSPICINFLDNFKFCSVSTSAKNVYLIQIPQLKHRNIQKESQTFSITKMEVTFPNYIDESNREIKYTKSYIGGDMKFYLISLTTGEILYFPSMSCLNSKNYLVLKAHNCQIANLIVDEGQKSFYTLGQKDQMLLEWLVEEQKPPFSQNHIKKVNASKYQQSKPDDFTEEFKRLQYISETVDNKTANYKASTFFFRGTKIEKLNASLHKYLNLETESYGSDNLDLMKRHCNMTLQTRAVYGLQTDKINQVRYLTRTADDNRIVYASSRFLIQYSAQDKYNKIHETIANRISFFDISQLGEIIYCQCNNNPRIYINGISNIETTHKNGIIHFTLYHDFILSYGISQDFFTINLHNFRTNQLIIERTTNLKIITFVIINESEFVSLNEIRKWQNMVSSEPLGLASAAVLLHNGKDVCLGGLHGQLSVLSENGIYEVAANAHSKAILIMKINKKQSGFELITVGQEEVLKIWNEYFQKITEINLSEGSSFELLKEKNNNFIAQRHPKLSHIIVKSIDCKDNKILLSLSYGQIWEYTITYSCDQITENKQIGSQVSIVSQTDQNISQNQQIQLEKVQLSYKSELKKILDSHCSQSQSLCKRYIVFDVHSSLPILASAGNDGRLIFRNYETDDIICNYLCEIDEKMCVRMLRFSPRGRMLVVGMSNGLVMTFFMQCIINSGNRIGEIKLNYFQTFKADSNCQMQILAIQFNATSDLFAVSYMPELSSTKKISSSQLQEGQSLIKCYKFKQQRNQNSDQAFYEFRNNIYLKEDVKTSMKFSKCVLKMHFQSQDNKKYLLIYEEYIDDQGNRVLSMKGRHSVYCLCDNSYIVDQFSVNWLNANFASLINFKIHDSHTEEQHQNYSLTSMLRLNDSLIYGGVDGKLQLVRLQSLDLNSPIKEYKIADMCLSRVYSSHTSFITDLKIAETLGDKGRKYLFVTGYSDQCLIKYEIIEEEVDCFQEYQVYPRQLNDDNLHGEFVNKNNFYLKMNNSQPLRQQITNILQDVERQSSPFNLKIVKIFGRRASDRRYNLAYYNDCALYSLGPNIVIQNLHDASVQELMKADPSPYSHCPQISTFHFNNKFLIIATEQERSSLYIWDIKSKSCISSMKVECSFIYGIRFSGQNYAIFYGINDKFELIVALVDWKNRKTLGKMRMAYSGNWIIRDICTTQFKGDNKEFITCGHIHLCYWEIRGDTLVYRNFNSQKNAKYMSVRQLSGYVVAGCQQGRLYLWKNFQLIHQLKQSHQAAIRCIEVDANNDLLISGGKDGIILFLKIEQSKLCIINRVDLQSDSTTNNYSCMSQGQPEKQDIEGTFKVQFQIQSLYPNAIQVSEDYQTLLVGTRSGNIYQIHYSDSSSQVILLFENHDYQTIVSVTFSQYDEEFFYTVTNAGIIQRWNLKSFVKELSFDLGQRALKIDSCMEYLMVCCRNDVLVYSINKDHNMLSKMDEMCIQTRNADNDSKDCQIIKFCLSKDKLNLALCIKMCSKEPTYIINIFEVGKKDYLFQLNNLKHQIDYLDFSSDQKYLLFKDKYEEIGMINLEKDYRRINTIFVEMNIEWEEEGLRISPKGQKIYYSYSCENKITAITRLESDKIIVGDEMGTIRVFQYPCPDDKLGELHLQCYTSHMNEITNIKVHHLGNYVITTALQDRSLILWKTEDFKKDEKDI